MKNVHNTTRGTRERGYTLTEVMVAITISVFLLMGLFTILQQTRKTAGTTTALAQLQDDERVAMTVLTDIIQQAGYVPEANGSGTSYFTSGGGFTYPGQVFQGGSGQVVGDKLVLRYVLASGDKAMTCLGGSNTGSEAAYVETFEINTFNGVLGLACSPNTGLAEALLVNNVVNMTFQFAVNTTAASTATPATSVGPNTETTSPPITGNGCPADTYITTAHMSPYDWTNVCAVKVDLVFVNPLYQPAGQATPTGGQPPYITFERVVGVQGKAGVNVSLSTQT